tara:strand:+ start:57 stop:209 length:153 start_codon:yes stop_codon:yes gene_type:complete
MILEFLQDVNFTAYKINEVKNDCWENQKQSDKKSELAPRINECKIGVIII